MFGKHLINEIILQHYILQQGLEDISTGSDLWTFDLPCLSQDTSLTDSPSEQLSNSLSDPGNPEMCDLFARFDLCDEEIKDFEFKDFETQ